MSTAAPFPKASVLLAMTLIRPLFERCHCDVSAYTDDEVAEALLRTHPSPAGQWLSYEHLSCASAQLRPTSPIGASALASESCKGVR